MRQSVEELDRIMEAHGMPYRLRRPSPIHGDGIFASQFIPKGTPVPMVPLDEVRSCGGFNHSCDNNLSSWEPNTPRVRIALRDIHPNDELTVSYGSRTSSTGRLPNGDYCNCQVCH